MNWKPEDIAEIAELIDEDLSHLGSEREVPLAIQEVMVPEWFKEWYDMLPDENKEPIKKMLVDPAKRERIIELTRSRFDV